MVAGDFSFGVGSESRNSVTVFPPGFGFIVPDGEQWGAGVHLLRTEALAGDNTARAVDECIECVYVPGKGPRCDPGESGTFECCESDSHCAVGPNPPPARAYKLRYTLSYTFDLWAITPVSTGTMAAPDCLTYYNEERNDAQPEHLGWRAGEALDVDPAIERAVEDDSDDDEIVFV